MLIKQESLWIHFGLVVRASKRSCGAMSVPMGGCTSGVPGLSMWSKALEPRAECLALAVLLRFALQILLSAAR